VGSDRASIENVMVKNPKETPRDTQMRIRELKESFFLLSPFCFLPCRSVKN